MAVSVCSCGDGEPRVYNKPAVKLVSKVRILQVPSNCNCSQPLLGHGQMAILAASMQWQTCSISLHSIESVIPMRSKE